VVSNCQLEIKAVKAHSSGVEARIHFVVEVHDREELLRLLGALKEVKSVKVVRRGGVISAK
jgi:(p)ppGpp synthase/HD superfamily hydrolase